MASRVISTPSSWAACQISSLLLSSRAAAPESSVGLVGRSIPLSLRGGHGVSDLRLHLHRPFMVLGGLGTVGVPPLSPVGVVASEVCSFPGPRVGRRLPISLATHPVRHLNVLCVHLLRRIAGPVLVTIAVVPLIRGAVMVASIRMPTSTTVASLRCRPPISPRALAVVRFPIVLAAIAINDIVPGGALIVRDASSDGIDRGDSPHEIGNAFSQWGSFGSHVPNFAHAWADIGFEGVHHVVQTVRGAALPVGIFGSRLAREAGEPPFELARARREVGQAVAHREALIFIPAVKF